MKLSISNIAWPVEHDPEVLDVLVELGVTGIEVAPTKIWSEPLKAHSKQIDQYRYFWEDRGVSIIAAQSLLYGHPELTVFGEAETQRSTFDYLERITSVCAQLGCQTLVFGSPRNRQIGSRLESDVWPEAVDFFGRLGEMADGLGTTIGIEANPVEYGADFITSASQAARLVSDVNHRGLRLHLDSACMHLAGDDPALIRDNASLLAHFHIAEPQLALISNNLVSHPEFGEALRAAGYDKWLSIEMRECAEFEIGQIRNAITLAQAAYPRTANVRDSLSLHSKAHPSNADS